MCCELTEFVESVNLKLKLFLLKKYTIINKSISLLQTIIETNANSLLDIIQLKQVGYFA